MLENGDAGPNDAVGPQSALQFALTNDQLVNRLEIVKTLLAYGADPRDIMAAGAGTDKGGEVGEDGDTKAKGKTMLEEMDPATRHASYFPT